MQALKTNTRFSNIPMIPYLAIPVLSHDTISYLHNNCLPSIQACRHTFLVGHTSHVHCDTGNYS